MKYTIIILFACSSAMSQSVIIDNLTVSDSLAKEYFLDLYKHPDTLWYRVQYHRAPTNREIKAKNPKIDTTFFTMGDSYMHTPPSDEILKQSIGRIYATYERQYMGYVMPRKPSARDFIRWFNERWKN